MITRIHVNQHHIKANAKDGGNRPVLSVKQRGRTTPCHEVKILGPSKLVYRPHKPLSCGAKVWIETKAEVEMFEIIRIEDIAGEAA